MPPRGHSSSSHSSHSHSSHSHSSSHHSSSSHSSHSSHSSYSYSRPVSTRSRRNQPSGYGSTVKRSVFRCRHHDYHYYDKGWSDPNTGASYRSGYYDEDGNYYKAVAIKDKSGSSFVFAACDYCGTEQRFAWREGIEANCPNCSAPFSLEGVIQDELVPDSGADVKKLLMIFFIVFAVTMVLPFVIIIIVFVAMATREKNYDDVPAYDEQDEAVVSNADIFGDTVYLEGNAGGAYRIVNRENGDFYNKRIQWDYGYSSYYDKTTDCYLWYNTDVAPNLWQYWYEGISSDYGDYGWMEYEDNTDDGIDNGLWYIEESEGNWVELPSAYDVTNLWHIAEE